MMSSVFLTAVFIVIFQYYCNAFQTYHIQSRILSSKHKFGNIQSLILSSTETSNDPVVPLTLKQRLTADMKDAMKTKNKTRLSAIKSIQAAIKQKEIDEQIIVDDEMSIAIMSKIVKQRKESIASYAAAGRSDLAESEQEELNTINLYLPAQLTQDEINQMIDEAIVALGASSIKDMNKVMKL